MARKYDLISELYNRTCKTVVSNPQNWQAFLASACRNYKLRYDEQLLVYAQRPDATAVLEIEQWNKIFGRWVNRGARGIAVFADENRSRQRLTHYFDISDTHESRYSRTVPIWDMRQEYEADVIETLESTFGEIENKSSLAEAIMGAARNAAEDNIPDYLQDLYYATEGSSFEEVEEDIVAFIYKNVVANSVAYMMMSRLGVDTETAPSHGHYGRHHRHRSFALLAAPSKRPATGHGREGHTATASMPARPSARRIAATHPRSYVSPHMPHSHDPSHMPHRPVKSCQRGHGIMAPSPSHNATTSPDNTPSRMPRHPI